MVIMDPKVGRSIAVAELVDDLGEFLVDLSIGLPPMIESRLVPIAAASGAGPLDIADYP